MKRRQFLVSAPILLAGCASWMKPNGNGEIDPIVMAYMVETAGIGVGAAVAQMPEEVDAILRNVYAEVGKKWAPEDFHKRIYELSRELDLKPPEAFKAVYLALIGKERGPKAAAFILSLDADFLERRFA